MKYFIVCFIFFYIFDVVLSSQGDRSQYFQNCVKTCSTNNCTSDGLEFSSKNQQNIINKMFLWSCHDECQYECMWKTTKLFLERKWPIPQFYGKWPFKRFFGLQEPASVIFSILNFIAHYKMLKKFRNDVRPDSPLYYTWHMFAGISLNGWFWSTVFHTRDFPITELLDYTFAYSMVLSSLCCTLIRIFYKKSFIIKLLITLISIFYFLNHFAYLSIGRFDYEYNMKANVVTGALSSLIWILWYIVNRKKSYSWKILVFTFLAVLALLLELKDFAPIYWTFDAHSIWHLSTFPLTFLFYSFIIEDCKSLRNKIDEEEKKLF